MKALLILVFGVALGVGGTLFFRQATTAATESAANLRDTLSQKIEDWHLTPDDIKSELQRTGEVVRTKAQEVGEKAGATIADARIGTVIRAKYVLDDELSIRAISVDVTSGDVTLTGTVNSNELIGRAVALALDTKGVNHVTAKLKVEN